MNDYSQMTSYLSMTTPRTSIGLKDEIISNKRHHIFLPLSHVFGTPPFIPTTIHIHLVFPVGPTSYQRTDLLINPFPFQNVPELLVPFLKPKIEFTKPFRKVSKVTFLLYQSKDKPIIWVFTHTYQRLCDYSFVASVGLVSVLLGTPFVRSQVFPYYSIILVPTVL